MSYPTPTTFYLVVWREDLPGQQYKVYTSVGTMLRMVEMARADPQHYDFGPFDVYVVNTETLEVGKYDTAPLLKLARLAARTK